MTSRERLFAALVGEPTDHVPIWLLFPYHTTGYYVDVRTLPNYCPIFEMSKRYAIMLNRRNFSVALHTPEVTRWRETFEEGGTRVTREYLEYRDESIYSEVRQSASGRVQKKLLDTDADLEFYCSLPINVDQKRIKQQLDQQLPQYLQEREAFPEVYGAMMLGLGEPTGTLYHASNLESYAIWSLTHDAMVVELLDRIMERTRIIYRYCLERDLADVYFLVGSELASPPLVKRDTFQRWSMWYAKELIEMVHAAGRLAIQHYHGQIREILPDFLETAPDGLHTIEDPPIGDCTFAQAYETVGDAITLIGNIQYDEFRSLSSEGMRAKVLAVLEECRGRRLILSPTAGPFDPEIPTSMVENYLTFMQTAWDYGPWIPAERN